MNSHTSRRDCVGVLETRMRPSTGTRYTPNPRTHVHTRVETHCTALVGGTGKRNWAEQSRARVRENSRDALARDALAWHTSVCVYVCLRRTWEMWRESIKTWFCRVICQDHTWHLIPSDLSLFRNSVFSETLHSSLSLSLSLSILPLFCSSPSSVWAVSPYLHFFFFFFSMRKPILQIISCTLVGISPCFLVPCFFYLLLNFVFCWNPCMSVFCLGTHYGHYLFFLGLMVIICVVRDLGFALILAFLVFRFNK